MNMCRCNCPIRRYVANGRGIGLKVVTLVGLLIGLIIAVSGPVIFLKTLNIDGSLDSFINSLPIVKIENGKIVDPIYDNEVWIIPDSAGDTQNDIKVIANTKIDDVDVIPSDVSAYITARTIYLSDGNQMRVFRLPEGTNTVITHDVLRSAVNKMIWGAGMILGFFIFVSGILGFLVGYIPLLIVGLIIGRKISADTWGRAFAWPWVIVWGIGVLGGMFGWFFLSLPYMFLVSLLLAWIIGIVAFNQSVSCPLNAGVTCLSGQAPDSNEGETFSNNLNPVEDAKIQPQSASPKGTASKKAVVKPKNIPVQRKKKKK